MVVEQTISVRELNMRIQRTLGREFDKDLWIYAKVSQPKISKGHTYLTLLNTEESGFYTPKSNAILWMKDRIHLNATYGKSTIDDLLKENIGIRIKVRVTFHVTFGLSLQIIDIDPEHTLENIEQKQRKVLLQLKSEHLLDKNQLLTLPPIIQNIAIISSKNAAGYADFISQLENNNNRFYFKTTLFEAAMQGNRTSSEVVHALQKITDYKNDFHLIVIIRGGGSKLDLASFDDYAIGKAIAYSPLPVFSGIGHEIDKTVVDFVAHLSFKTPTAVSEHIIHHNRYFHEFLITVKRDINDKISTKLLTLSHHLSQASQKLHHVGQSTLHAKESSVIHCYETIGKSCEYFIKMQNFHISDIDKNIELKSKNLINNYLKEVQFIWQSIKHFDPKHILKLGYSITRKEGKVLKQAHDLNLGDVIETQFAKGKIHTYVRE